MKSKKEINKLAVQIAEFEKQAQKFYQQGLDKSLQSQLRKIEVLLETLTPEEGLELNDTVIKILKNS